MKNKEEGTWINYEMVKKLKLKHSEYCVWDSIDRLSNSPKYPYCLMSKKSIGERIGLTERGVGKIIKRLLIKGLIESSGEGKYRSSGIWKNDKEQSSYPSMNKVPTDKEQSSGTQGTKSAQTGNIVPTDREQSSYYNNNKIIDKKNKPTNIEMMDGFSLEEKKPKHNILSNAEIKEKFNIWYNFYPRHDQKEKAYKMFYEKKLYNGEYDNLNKATRLFINRMGDREERFMKMACNFLEEYQDEFKYRAN